MKEDNISNVESSILTINIEITKMIEDLEIMSTEAINIGDKDNAKKSIEISTRLENFQNTSIT